MRMWMGMDEICGMCVGVGEKERGEIEVIDDKTGAGTDFTVPWVYIDCGERREVNPARRCVPVPYVHFQL